MNFVSRTLSLGAFVLLANVAQAECVEPVTPDTPDGQTASMEEMVAGQKAVKAFIAESTDFLACLDEVTAAAGEDEDPEVKLARNARYDANVTEQENVAGDFNAQIKVYKAR